VAGSRAAVHGGSCSSAVAWAWLRQHQPPQWWLRRVSRADVNSLFGGVWGGVPAAASVAEGAWAHGEGRTCE
jgi:hypothetical protein